MADVQELARLRASFERLMHLSGYAAAIGQRAIEDELTAIAIEKLATEEPDMAVAEILRQAAADARSSAEAGKASSEAVAAAIDAAIARLSDNNNIPQADADAILADLQAAKTANEAGKAADEAALAGADTIDPAIDGGVVTDPEDDGEVIEG